jgi:hypothetical protein
VRHARAPRSLKGGHLAGEKIGGLAAGRGERVAEAIVPGKALAQPAGRRQELRLAVGLTGRGTYASEPFFVLLLFEIVRDTAVLPHWQRENRKGLKFEFSLPKWTHVRLPCGRHGPKL